MKPALFLVAAVAACSRAAAAPPPPAATCESCHADVAREHQASFHRAAFTDETYQASLALEEPKEHAFCNGCHAPDGAAAGVGCASCHGDAHAHGKKRLAAAESCKKCHEFTFNDGRADLVQRTISEHDASELSAVPCTQCHMERGKRRNHEFASGHSLAWLKGSLRVKARRVGADHVRVAIESFAGHAFPTGDMFRRARLLVFGEREDGAIVGSAERVFGRTWGHRVDGLRQELSDTRIRGHFDEELALDAATPITRVRYVVLFERVLAQRGDNVTLVSSDPIAEGTAE